jgi:hypothetical protein
MLSEATDQDDTTVNGQALRDVRVMNDEGLTFGLPGPLFFGGLALSGAFAFLLPWFVGVLFGIVYFMAMYGIHTNDPKALTAWVEALNRCNVWSGGTNKGRQIFYLSEGE